MPLRAAIRHVVRTFGNKPLIGVEVGVYIAKHARMMLKNMSNLKKLYLVDPYIRYEGFIRPYAVPMERAKVAACKVMEPFEDRIHWIFEKFDYGQISEKVDFVYIDGNHTYPYVKSDIEVSESIIQPNGVICGHNYQKECPGVVRAVDEYCERKGYTLKRERRTDWWTIEGKI